MANIKLPYFGTMDPADLEEYYDTDIEFNGRQVQLDINFESRAITIERLDTVKQFIENLRIHDLNNKKYLISDFDNEDGDTVRFYIEKQLEELATDDLYELVGAGAKSKDQPHLLLKKIHLVRVGLYPENTEQFAVFDYSIGKELTNHVVVITTDENGNLDQITMESL